MCWWLHKYVHLKKGKKKSWIIQSKFIPLKVRILKQISQTFCTQGKIISSSSLPFFQLFYHLSFPC